MPSRPIGSCIVLICLAAIAFASNPVHAQRGGRDRRAEPFRGIAASGEIERGLFEIASTGVSTAPVVEAAKQFLAGLSDMQLNRTLFPVEDPEWRMWNNVHRRRIEPMNAP